MFCRSCGSEVAEGVSFCAKCGTPVDNSATQGTQGQMAASSQPPAQMASTGGYAQPDYSIPQATFQQAPYSTGSSVSGVYPTGAQANGAGYGTDPEAIYPMSESDRTLRLIAFILAVISTVACGVFIIPLAWMIPMTVHLWGIYKGKKPNTTAFGVCSLFFFGDCIVGILLLVSKKDV